MLYTYDVKYGPAFTIRDIQKNKRCDSLTEPGYTRAKEAKIQEVKNRWTGIRTGTISSSLAPEKWDVTERKQIETVSRAYQQASTAIEAGGIGQNFYSIACPKYSLDCRNWNSPEIAHFSKRISQPHFG